MTGSGEARNPWWDPIGVWQRTGSVFADLSADQGLAAPSSWNALQTMFDALRSGLVGRPVAVGSGESRVAFTITSLEATVGHMAAAAGQVDDVSLDAKDVSWRSYRFAHVSASLGNVHTRFRSRPLLVSAPIDGSAVLTAEALNEVLARVAPLFKCEITPAGELRLRSARRPLWGYVQVSPAVEHGALVLRPTGVGRGARLWRLGGRMVPLRPRSNLPGWVRLIGVELHPGSVEVLFRIDEWNVDSLELMSLVRKSRQPDAVKRNEP